MKIYAILIPVSWFLLPWMMPLGESFPTVVEGPRQHNCPSHSIVTPDLSRRTSTLLFASSPKKKKQSATSATTSSSSSSSRTSRIASLMSWATTSSIQVTSAVELTSANAAGLGWFARSSTSVKPGSVLIAVPSSLALSVEVPGSGPDDSRVWEDLLTSASRDSKSALSKLPWFVQMALYLYKLDQVDASKRVDSKIDKGGVVNMRTWLDSLPRSFDTPIHWTQSQREELQYDSMLLAVQQQEMAWKRYYQTIQQAAGTSNRPTASLSWDVFCWACECARSRAFSGPYTGSAFNPAIYAFTLLLVTAYVGLNLGTVEQAANGAAVVVCASLLKDFVLPKIIKSKRYVICPMIDMANHCSSPTLPLADVSFEYFGNAYSLATSSSSVAIDAGEQIFISYGSRSNDQLLQYYGFVEPNNPHDVYVMKPIREWDISALERAVGRTFAPGRLEKLDRAGLLGSTVLRFGDDSDDIEGSEGEHTSANARGGVVITRTGGIDPAVLQALRALVSSDAEWDAAGQAVGNFATSLSGGPENERCARLAARRAIELELDMKPTTAEEDIDILNRMETMKSVDTSQVDKLAVQFRIEKKKLLTEAIQMLQN